MIYNRLKILLIFVIFGWCAVWAPSSFAEQAPDGGTKDIFAEPVGAQALSMGGAYVAVSHDATALYWNPASLESSAHYNLCLYYTNLPEGTAYNYLAYAHPTLSIGTFAIGVVHISSGDIELRDRNSPLLLGISSFSKTQFILGYAYRFFDWISIGTSFKVERNALPPYPEDATTSFPGADNKVSPFVVNGVGSDFGVLFTPQLKSWVLSDISVGLSLQNLLQRSIRAKTEEELAPRNLRVGLAKGIRFGDGGNRVLLAFELDRAEKNPFEYHFGAEYDFRHNAMLRVGYYSERDTGGMTYGIGARFTGVQIDYSYWNGRNSDLLGSSHRISLTLEFGKSREQRRRDIEQKQLEEIRRAAQQERNFEARTTITTNLSKAHAFFLQKDYPRASAALRKILFYEEIRDDVEIAQARELYAQIDTKTEEQRQKEEDERRIKDERERERLRRSRLIKDHYDKALAFFENEDYIEAMEECNRALEIDSSSQQIKDLKEKADRDLREKVYKLTSKADISDRRNLTMEAIELYTQARNLAKGIPEYSTYADGRIRELQNKLKFDDLLRRAENYENAKDFKSASDIYQRALSFQPNNKTIREKLEFVKARSQAKDMPMTPEVESLWKEGMKKALSRQYKEAIDYFEKALQLQPYNKTLLDALDSAQENLKKGN